VKVRLCGVRGSTPAPGAAFAAVGGNTACVAITTNDRSVPTLVLDAGTGIRSVTDLLAPLAFRGTILLSHLHWDHVQGLPFFSAGDRSGSVVQLLIPLDRDDPSGDAAGVLRRTMSPPHFPIGPEGLQGKWTFDFIDEGAHSVEGLAVEARAVPHKGGRTFGYRISDGDGSLVYIPDHLPAAEGPTREAAIELARGADVLIHDSQFVTAEHAVAEAYGHSTLAQAVELAVAAGVGELVLFHHAPGRTDDQLQLLFDDLGEGRFGPLTITLGREGDEFTPSGVEVVSRPERVRQVDSGG
jgi:ribonuclease BN (tRNA processing enzyme)